MSIEASLKKNTMFHVELKKIDVPYSSTCPCSAALSRQLIQQQFVDDFANRSLQHADVLAWLGSTKGIVATPHSQRSNAQLQLRLDDYLDDLPLIAAINDAEAALGTAVQTAVKRADEQAFALANGQNLMFCEDAARRLNLALKRSPGINAFSRASRSRRKSSRPRCRRRKPLELGGRMIQCQALRWGAPGQPLTPSMDFQLPKGSLTAVIGANGSGKSSLLKVIAGLQKNHSPAKSSLMFHAKAAFRSCLSNNTWTGNSPSACKSWWPQVSGATSKLRKFAASASSLRWKTGA